VKLRVTALATGLGTNTAPIGAGEFDPALAKNSASETPAVVRKWYLPLVQRGP